MSSVTSFCLAQPLAPATGYSAVPASKILDDFPRIVDAAGIENEYCVSPLYKCDKHWPMMSDSSRTGSNTMNWPLMSSSVPPVVANARRNHHEQHASKAI